MGVSVSCNKSLAWLVFVWVSESSSLLCLYFQVQTVPEKIGPVSSSCSEDVRSFSPELEKEKKQVHKNKTKNYNLTTQLLCSNDRVYHCKHTTIVVTMIFVLSLMLLLILKTKQHINATLAESKILHGVISPDLYRKPICKLTCAGHRDSFSFHVVVGNLWSHQSTAESAWPAVCHCKGRLKGHSSVLNQPLYVFQIKKKNKNTNGIRQRGELKMSKWVFLHIRSQTALCASTRHRHWLGLEKAWCSTAQRKRFTGEGLDWERIRHSKY